MLLLETKIVQLVLNQVEIVLNDCIPIYDNVSHWKHFQ